MFTRLALKLSSPLFEDAQRMNHTKILNTVIVFTLFTVTVFGAVFIIFSQIQAITLVFIAIFDSLMLLSLYLLQKGHLWITSLVYTLALWSATTFIVVWIHGGLGSPAIELFLLSITIAGLLLGGAYGFIFAGLSILTVIGIVIASWQGWVPKPMVFIEPYLPLLYHFLSFFLAAMLVQIITRTIRDALKQARHQQQLLLEKNYELEEIRATLEERIADRTLEILWQKNFFEALVENSPLAIVVEESDHTIISCNPAFEKLFGYNQEEAAGKDLDQIITTPDKETEAASYTQMVLQGETIHKVSRRRCKDGSLVWVEIYGVPVIVGDHQVGVFAIYNDITERRQYESALQAAKERAEQLYRVVPSAIFTVDENQIVTSINAKAAEITGFSPEEVIGKPCTVFSGGQCLQSCGMYREDIPKPIIGAEGSIINKQGEKRTIRKNAELLRDSQGNVVGGIESFDDITERKRDEEYLSFIATHDPLTVLPNRSFFYELLRQALERAKITNRHVAVMFLDLDGFKSINDSYGHAEGDMLLKAVAIRLKSYLRKSDTVARIGGDEFTFIFQDIDYPDEASIIAQKILAALSAPIEVNRHSLKITASIGISLSPQDGEDAETLIQHADTAMYSVKEIGKNNYQFFRAQDIYTSRLGQFSVADPS